jgi:hypothetical protein
MKILFVILLYTAAVTIEAEIIQCRNFLRKAIRVCNYTNCFAYFDVKKAFHEIMRHLYFN